MLRSTPPTGAMMSGINPVRKAASSVRPRPPNETAPTLGGQAATVSGDGPRRRAHPPRSKSSTEPKVPRGGSPRWHFLYCSLTALHQSPDCASPNWAHLLDEPRPQPASLGGVFRLSPISNREIRSVLNRCMTPITAPPQAARHSRPTSTAHKPPHTERDDEQ